MRVSNAVEVMVENTNMCALREEEVNNARTAVLGMSEEYMELHLPQMLVQDLRCRPCRRPQVHPELQRWSTYVQHRVKIEFTFQFSLPCSTSGNTLAISKS